MNNNQRYRGFSPLRVSLDFQVSIPPLWRPEAGASLFLQLSKEQELPMMKVLSQQAHEEKIRLIIDSCKTPVEKGIMLDRLSMVSRKVCLNSMGKLRIPIDLGDQAGITAESEVILAGRGSHYEIWSMANFATILNIETSLTEGEDMAREYQRCIAIEVR